MTLPKVSICIPAYKQVEYLQKTLESIKNQTFNDYEIILTDDSPDDSVKQLVGKFDFHGKLKYCKNQKTLGSPENWNEAIRLATGEYIKIMHHDDWFTSGDSLDEFVRLLDTHPEANFAFSATRVWNTKNNQIYINKPEEDEVRELHDDSSILFFKNIIGAPSATIYRRNIREKFDINLKWVVDFDFYIRVLRKSKFVYTEKTLICTPHDAGHQVTQDCAQNKLVNVFEFTYLFNKLFANHDLKNRKMFVTFFRNLYGKYSIYSIRDYNKLGITSFEFPKSLNIIFLYLKFEFLKHKMAILLKKFKIY